MHVVGILPIEPYWNWNLCRYFALRRQWTPNRTILELKHEYCFVYHIVFNFSQSNHTGIETYFFRYRLCCATFSQSNHTGIETTMSSWWSSSLVILPIEPYWNWNRIIRRDCCVSWYLPIEPYWNWNWFYGVSYGLAIPPNRTILELKQIAYAAWELTCRSPNRTILELKQHSKNCC